MASPSIKLAVKVLISQISLIAARDAINDCKSMGLRVIAPQELFLCQTVKTHISRRQQSREAIP